MANIGGKAGGRVQAKPAADVKNRDQAEVGQADVDSEPPVVDPGVPRWRQIEIMHERAQLRQMLDDLDMDFDELEVEVFGSEEEHDVLYRNAEELGDEDEIELDDDDEDDFEDDEYEDLED